MKIQNIRLIKWHLHHGNENTTDGEESQRSTIMKCKASKEPSDLV